MSDGPVPPTAQLGDLVRRAYAGGVEVTLARLIEVCGPGAGILTAITGSIAIVESFGLELVPCASTGDLKDVRVLRRSTVPEISDADLKKIILDGENQVQEVKSSLLYDRRRAERDASATPSELKSMNVLHSALKTVAAFMNTEGGRLLIGVLDDQRICGIQDDQICLQGEALDRDVWELELRNQIDGKFLNGNRVNDYVRVSFVDSGECTVAILDVQARSELCYLKKAGQQDWNLYRRQGNRTVDVKIHEVESYLVACAR